MIGGCQLHNFFLELLSQLLNLLLMQYSSNTCQVIGGCQLHNLSLELLPQQFHLLLINKVLQYYLSGDWWL